MAVRVAPRTSQGVFAPQLSLEARRGPSRWPTHVDRGPDVLLKLLNVSQTTSPPRGAESFLMNAEAAASGPYL